MLFNFLTFPLKENGLQHLKYTAVEAASSTDAVKIYISGDSLDTGYVVFLILNVIYYEGEPGEFFEIARSSRDKFEEATGLGLDMIAEFYSLDEKKLQTAEDGYRQVIDENLDEITKFVNGISYDRPYFRVIPIEMILTGLIVKSATKR